MPRNQTQKQTKQICTEHSRPDADFQISSKLDMRFKVQEQRSNNEGEVIKYGNYDSVNNSSIEPKIKQTKRSAKFQQVTANQQNSIADPKEVQQSKSGIQMSMHPPGPRSIHRQEPPAAFGNQHSRPDSSRDSN